MLPAERIARRFRENLEKPIPEITTVSNTAEKVSKVVQNLEVKIEPPLRRKDGSPVTVATIFEDCPLLYKIDTTKLALEVFAIEKNKTLPSLHPSARFFNLPISSAPCRSFSISASERGPEK